MSQVVGHLDVYVNGGNHQPSCSPFQFSCSHSKAWQLFIKSLNESVSQKELITVNCQCYELTRDCMKIPKFEKSIFGLKSLQTSKLNSYPFFFSFFLRIHLF